MTARTISTKEMMSGTTTTVIAVLTATIAGVVMKTMVRTVSMRETTSEKLSPRWCGLGVECQYLRKTFWRNSKQILGKTIDL